MHGGRLAVNNLTHTYEQDGRVTPALSLIEMRVSTGEFVAIVGPSGCGKTTLLNLIAGLLPIQQGTIIVDANHLKDVMQKKRLALVFQNPALLPWRTVYENMTLPFELTHTPVVHDVINRVLHLVLLSGFERYYPHELSGGMQSRVALARALLLDPNILLMDEPFGALDEVTAHMLNKELLTIWEQQAMSVLFVTHNVSQAVFMANRIVVISPRPGRIIKNVMVDLPYPRTEETMKTKRFVELTYNIRSYMEEPSLL